MILSAAEGGLSAGPGPAPRGPYPPVTVAAGADKYAQRQGTLTIMNVQPHAEIISYNIHCNEVCASAARISTTQGDANEIFEKAKENPKNLDLIRKVLNSGHKSFLEHAVFTIAFWNISAFVEQYFIECRLASFTVKSRRYVDFSKFGYHIPPELEGDALEEYRRYMDRLFSAYGALLDAGVPREDARFVLPYSFHSNFYCTINARELAHVISSIRHGRGRGVPELRCLAEQLLSQARDIFPGFPLEPDAPGPDGQADPDGGCFVLEPEPRWVHPGEAGSVQLVSAPSAPLDLLRAAHRISAPHAARPFDAARLVEAERARELEQLTYSFLISDVTLSGITHLVRHRMQSILLPPIQSVNHSRYIAPASIRALPEAWDIYASALGAAHGMLREAADSPSLRKYGYYYALSGNLMDVMTTINARELRLFLQLRTCNRAQWEVREVAVSMLRRLREHCPELYGRFGPSCYLLGRCPEGKLTCGNMTEVAARFKGDL